MIAERTEGGGLRTEHLLHRCPEAGCGGAMKFDGELSEKDEAKLKASGLLEGRVVISVEAYKCLLCGKRWPVSEDREVAA